ncbi:MAG: PHB depolymerase family esterase [Pseudomonadota bacterium]
MIKRVLLGTALVITLAIGYGTFTFFSFKAGLPEPAGELRTFALSHAGLQRSYNVYRPVSLPDNAPVVFVLHGSMGSGLGMRDMSAREFDMIADREGWLVVYPDGFENHWNGCRSTADYTANVSNIDDVGFLSLVVQSLANDYAIDATRVYITGVSNGGHMAYRMALEAPGVFAAYAPMAASLPAPETFGCGRLNQPVSLAIFNGTQDPVNPYLGGAVSVMGNDSRGVVLSSAETAAYWRELAGLDKAARELVHPERDGDTTTRIVEQRWGEAPGYEVRLYTMEGSGHTMPTLTSWMPDWLAALLGGNAGDLSGAEEALSFFSSHRLEQ